MIINMSSINSGLANPRVATYAITKGGMNQITGTAAVAFARNGIVPGPTPTTRMSEPVAQAYLNALALCETESVAILWVHDPLGLFPPRDRPELEL